VAAPGEAMEEEEPELELKELEPDSEPLSSMLLSEENEEDSSAPISSRRVGMGAPWNGCICAAVMPTQNSRIAAAKSLLCIL